MGHAIKLLLIDIKDQLAGFAFLAIESIAFYLIYKWWSGGPEPDLITWIVFLLMVLIVDLRGFHIEREQERDEA